MTRKATMTFAQLPPHKKPNESVLTTTVVVGSSRVTLFVWWEVFLSPRKEKKITTNYDHDDNDDVDEEEQDDDDNHFSNWKSRWSFIDKLWNVYVRRLKCAAPHTFVEFLMSWDSPFANGVVCKSVTPPPRIVSFSNNTQGAASPSETNYNDYLKFSCILHICTGIVGSVRGWSAHAIVKLVSLEPHSQMITRSWMLWSCIGTRLLNTNMNFQDLINLRKMSTLLHALLVLCKNVSLANPKPVSTDSFINPLAPKVSHSSSLHIPTFLINSQFPIK